MTASGQQRAERRLAAILAADVAGYSRLIGIDEAGTLGRLRSIRAELIDPSIAAHRGRLVKTTGDGLLVEFASVVDALRCASELQQAIADRSAGVPPAERIEFRIGINVGDVVVEDGDIFGDAVNVAARLESLAEPGGICVSARVQEDAAGRLDLAFDDIGEQQLKNIARPVRVYRVVRPTSALPDPLPRAGEASAALAARVGAEARLPLPDKPSIAVLPFQNMSGDPEQEYFVDGMVEEIITALSRIRWLFVIARNSSFTYKGQAVDVKQVGRELGVRYVLEGSVRKAGGQVRIAAQLIDAETGAHLWADRFDGSLEDVFDLQDQVAISVVGVIEPALQAAEIRRAATRPTHDMTTYDLYLRALACFWTLSREGIVQARGLLERAIERDPNCGPALSLAARCHLRAYLDGWAEHPEGERHKGIDRARRALALARDDPITLAGVAFVLTEFGEDIGATTALIDRALALHPSYAHGWFISGAIRLNAGECAKAIEHIEHALRLAPRDRLDTAFTFLGYAYFLTRRFDEAVSNFLRAIGENPGLPWPHWALASCYAHMGQLAQARDVLERVQLLTPCSIPTHIPWRDPEHRELFLSGLRLAMGETA